MEVSLPSQHDTVKNSWMGDPRLVSEAVEAVECGRGLKWKPVYRHGGTTWREYKCAAAWVVRERQKRRAGNSRDDSSQARPASIAANALHEANSAKETEKAALHSEIAIRPAPEPVETRILNGAKGFALQIVGICLAIPLAILFGTDMRHGGVIGLILFICLLAGSLVGIVVLVFRSV